MKRIRIFLVSRMVVALAIAGAASAMAQDSVALTDKSVFPPDNPWNTDISAAPIDPHSAEIIAAIGAQKPLHPDFGTRYGIPYNVVDSSTPKVPVVFAYADESDQGPYPIPAKPLIEDGGDRHLLVIDASAWVLYELWDTTWQDGKWHAGSGAIWDLKVNATRPAGWTSADAAGLPIFPGLVRYDEVHLAKAINHAIRFTVPATRQAYVAPASHWASKSNDPNLPPMGARFRLKADFDISRFPEDDQVILTALKRYGMILADNGGTWFLSGAPDSRWDDDMLHALTKVKGSDFEVVPLGTVVHPK